MADPYRTTRLVEFSDTDMAGIVHFSAFFRYMESVEHEMLRSWGFSVYDEHDGSVISFPRVAASCEYRAPARCENLLDVEVSVASLSPKSVTYVFRFLHQEQELATGQITAVCCRIEHGCPLISVPIPEEMATKLRSLLPT